MTKRMLEAKTPVERNGKTYWTKIGVAFETSNGGWSVQLDALPVNGKIVLMEKQERGERRGREDDEVPFG